MIMDENALLQASKNGDVEAFNVLVLEYQGQIFNVCYRMLGDPSSAEDMTQEAFVSAYKNIKRFKEGNFRAWLFRIASNSCRDYLRSPRLRKSQSLELIEETFEGVLISNLESPDNFAIRKELSGVIQVALLKLPEDQRFALILVDVQGMSYEEAANILDTPIGTVKSRLSRAREAVRRQLVKQKELLPTQFR
jgi:RNA polymerase sigma factor (sigma-70 family)